jgi:hypothetical protein
VSEHSAQHRADAAAADASAAAAAAAFVCGVRAGLFRTIIHLPTTIAIFPHIGNRRRRARAAAEREMRRLRLRPAVSTRRAD